MSLFQALVLGIVQGLTEFLPISSSGHLVLVPFIAGWDEPSLTFIVAAHLGTLLAVLWVFRTRLAGLVRSLLGQGSPADRRFVWLLVLGTVPAAVIGAAFSDQIERSFERPVISAFLLAVTGWVLLSTESAYRERQNEGRPEETLSTLDAGTVGVAQAIAILPGISRSGSTIAAGMLRGLNREAATRFSFLLSIPIIIGAVAVKIPDMVREGAGGDGGAIVLGILTSAVAGVLSIRAMLGFVARRGMRPFGIYCFFATTAGLLTALARG